MVEETAGSELEAEAEEEKVEKVRRGGPGFILGLLLGAITGGVAATLLTPAEDDAKTGAPGETAPAAEQPFGAAQGPPTERIREMLNTVRSRMREAAEEGRIAAREEETSTRARYSELTHDGEAHGQKEDYL